MSAFAFSKRTLGGLERRRRVCRRERRQPNQNGLMPSDDTHKSLSTDPHLGKPQQMSIAPFVQTPLEVAKKMLELSKIKEGDTLYDMGCGDGRLIILAGKDIGAKATGIELREDLVERARTEIKRLNVEDKVRVIQGNFFDVNISDADVITLYLTSSANERLRPKLESELKQGARVVSHDFKVPGWKPSAVYDELLGHTIYTYRIGEQL